MCILHDDITGGVDVVCAGGRADWCAARCVRDRTDTPWTEPPPPPGPPLPELKKSHALHNVHVHKRDVPILQ
ncbi:unnamed protein product [Boreogadus saida]